MDKSRLNKYDFKKFLLSQMSDCRQEELIFWKKTIPMPVDLIYDLYEKRDLLLGKYLNHIGAAFLSAFINKENGEDWIEQLSIQPNAENKSNKKEIANTFTKYLLPSGILILLSELAELLFLENYFPDENAFAEAICHEGRKYRRLWLPYPIRAKINGVFPELLEHIGISNWDMFSNVVADELKIYRMGFADAFSGIFNKLIEFTLNSKEIAHQIPPDSTLELNHQQVVLNSNKIEIIYGVISDGSIWEPRYENGITTFIFNIRHPFCDEIKKMGPDAEQVLGKLITAMAVKENSFLRQSDKRLIENFRQDISRELRIRLENEN